MKNVNYGKNHLKQPRNDRLIKQKWNYFAKSPKCSSILLGANVKLRYASAKMSALLLIYLAVDA